MSNVKLELCFCDNDELREVNFSLRYKVFCEEKGFEEINKEKRESDLYDEDALIYLFRDAISGEYVGCFRYLAKLSPAISNASYVDKNLTPSATLIDKEISRFLLLKPYRSANTLLQAFELISNFLCEINEHAYALVDRRLGASLIRAGYNVKLSSSPVFHRGERSVYIIYNGINKN